MKQVFISDLHLSPQKPELSQLFQAFLSQHSGPQFTIYILGDLFDIWLGDDFSSQFYQADIHAIKNCTDQGSQLLLMHGNRDFLVGDDFANSCGITLLKDPTLIELHGQATLLCHGDLLCTDDTGYQQFRSDIQNDAWISEFLAKSPQERLQIAEHFRKESSKLSKEKSDMIMDVNQQAVKDLMSQHGITQLIHGHTHRPNKHEFTVNNSRHIRWVLGDWHPSHAQYLCVTDHDINLEYFKT